MNTGILPGVVAVYTNSDLDLAPVEVFSRISRLARHLDLARRDAFTAHGIESWEFDVLAALRQGAVETLLVSGDSGQVVHVAADEPMQLALEASAITDLGFDEVKFPKPVFYGDTLRIESEVVAVRDSGSRPTAGIVTWEHRAINQCDEIVCTMKRSALLRRKPA